MKGGVAYGYEGCVNTDDFIRYFNRVYHVRLEKLAFPRPLGNVYVFLILGTSKF
ncbi:cytochrome p450 [Oceanobacillus picturae]|uniref:Cytochrome p450 n=1 Tax=Oceanobacillus picturae TaxID=171693 RepID=A0A0U9H6K3_9BACI|nr:cytochrome p450 [Oceanobacillus picturae]